MIVFLQDEVNLIKSYLRELEDIDMVCINFHRADKLLAFVEKKFDDIELVVLDVVVEGVGNEICQNGGQTTGIKVLDKIEEIAAGRPLPKIIFLSDITKPEVWEELGEDSRIACLPGTSIKILLHKISTLPVQFSEIVKKLLSWNQEEK